MCARRRETERRERERGRKMTAVREREEDDCSPREREREEDDCSPRVDASSARVCYVARTRDKSSIL
jgi:hypothetical protein